MKTNTLGVAIIAKNAALRLAQCLQSVAFADDIVVVDSGSTDNTCAIARDYGVRVVMQTHWLGFGRQKNHAISALKTRWILSLDADEMVSPELANAIQMAIIKPTAQVYAVNRLSYFCGQWIYHSGWYPDWLPRLFRQGAAYFSDDLVHEHLIFDGKAGDLSGHLIHYAYEDFETVLNKMNAYSTAAAQQRYLCGQDSSVSKAIVRSLYAFLRTYFLRRGFLDGRAGWMISVLNAQTVYYRFLKLALMKQSQDV